MPSLSFHETASRCLNKYDTRALGSSIHGVIIGPVLVLGIMFFAFGDSLGMRGPSTTTVKVESPKVPVPK